MSIVLNSAATPNNRIKTRFARAARNYSPRLAALYARRSAPRLRISSLHRDKSFHVTLKLLALELRLHFRSYIPIM